MWPIVLTSLILGGISGFVMHRADFCMAGTFRDLFLFRRTNMLKALLILISTAALLSYLARLCGLVTYFPYPFFGSPATTNIIGGLFFGIGMVLCGSCVVGTLYRLGAGSKLAATTLAGLICGSALYAELHLWWKSLALSKPWATIAITLPQALNLPEEIFLAVLAICVYILCLRNQQFILPPRNQLPKGYLPPHRAALFLAIIGIVSVMLIGMPLGITTAYAKIAAQIENLIWPSHIEATAFFQAQPLNYLAPLGDTPLIGGAGPSFDGIAAVQYPLLLGVIGGAGLSALLLSEWRLSLTPPRRQLIAAFTGGIIMALGSRMTPGCNVWHLWGGLPIFTLQSILFLCGLLPGAWLGGQLLTRLVLSPATVHSSPTQRQTTSAAEKGVAYDHPDP